MGKQNLQTGLFLTMFFFFEIVYPFVLTEGISNCCIKWTVFNNGTSLGLATKCQILESLWGGSRLLP